MQLKRQKSLLIFHIGFSNIDDHQSNMFISLTLTYEKENWCLFKHQHRRLEVFILPLERSSDDKRWKMNEWIMNMAINFVQIDECLSFKLPNSLCHILWFETQAVFSHFYWAENTFRKSQIFRLNYCRDMKFLFRHFFGRNMWFFCNKF